MIKKGSSLLNAYDLHKADLSSIVRLTGAEWERTSRFFNAHLRGVVSCKLLLTGLDRDK